MKDLHTFGELIRENKIVIPKIQRDYVQGSNAQQEKRDEFLAVLLDHLVSDKEYHLDFIYGTGGTDQGEFLPLDGQQRLTTIFLIHWVLSQRSGIRDIEVKDYFSYQKVLYFNNLFYINDLYMYMCLLRDKLGTKIGVKNAKKNKYRH